MKKKKPPEYVLCNNEAVEVFYLRLLDTCVFSLNFYFGTHKTLTFNSDISAVFSLKVKCKDSYTEL